MSTNALEEKWLQPSCRSAIFPKSGFETTSNNISTAVHVMIEMLYIGVKDVIAYRIDGKVTEDEMKSVIAVFKEKIQGGEKLSIYHFLSSSMRTRRSPLKVKIVK